ncbi:hypothetical protein AAFC00_005463 [Neodothiora populina]|uniref:Uracil permease n=1 Tax=Neodothiora populina TaxID=2781224 RepID=A0ABR3PKY4_9PEZI
MAVQARFRARTAAIQHAFSSKDAFLSAMETKESATGQLAARNRWSNEDLDISPKKDWTWHWYDYAMFWWSYGFSTGVWSAGSSMIAIGLNWWQAIICVFIAHLLGAIGMVMHSRSAAVYHFGFPVSQRVPWGMIGAYFPVLVRVLVGTIWVGVQIAQGGFFTAVLLRAIFGHSFANLTSSIPKSSDITVQQLIGVLLFWILSLPLLAVPVPKIRFLYTAKSFILPPVVIGLFIFCILKDKSHAAGSFGKDPIKGSALAWVMLSGVNSLMGKTSTSIVNQPDLARYAATPNAPFWSQLLALPIGNTLCATLGIFATSAIKSAWGKTYWNPWDLCGAILDRYWSAGSRTGIALVSMGFLLSIFASNLGVNVIPWGADTTLLLPRYVNIKRGMYISYILGLVICPWKILVSAKSFLTFLGGYSIFLGPLVGIVLTDYLVVRKGNICIRDLYTAEKNARYWYTAGISWRAAFAYLLSVVWPIPGFTKSFGRDVPEGWVRVYQLGWLLTCVLSSVVYFAFCRIGNMGEEERKLGFEEMASNLFDETAEEITVEELKA